MAVLLAFPVIAYTAPDYSITIMEVSVLGCGPGTPVYFAGTTEYGRDPDQKCTRLFDQKEGQGYFNQPAMATWCDRRMSWNFTKQDAPGDYVFRAYVTSSGFFNQAWKDMTFHVPACTCQ